jgi:DNA-binding GntR family transcriptional regulator
LYNATIYQAYNQPHLLDLIQKLRNKVAPYNRIYLDVPGRKQAAWADHRRIYDACCRQDGELAEIETRKHLQQVYAGVMTAVESSSK